MKEFTETEGRPLGSKLVSQTLLVGSLVFGSASGWLSWALNQQFHLNGGFLTGNGMTWAVAFGLLPFCFSLLGIAASIGLFRLQEWARKATIFLSVVPVLCCALLLLTQPVFMFPPSKPYESTALLTIHSGLEYNIYTALLVVLTPFSVWFLLTMTNPQLRASFQQKAVGSSQLGSALQGKPKWVLCCLALMGVIVLSALIVGAQHW